MNLQQYRTFVKTSAIYDVVATSAFAVPVLATLKLNLLRDLHISVGAWGSFPEFSGMHLLFVNLLGAIVTVWSVLRIKHPERLFGYYDSIARFAFSFLMAIALLNGATALILLFLVPEILWGVFQLRGYYSVQDAVDSAFPLASEV